MELGVGYLSIVADTSKLPGQVVRALDGAQSQADKSGQGIGSKLATGLGKTLKAGVVGAGAAAAGVLATSITKGLGRLNAIEQAQAKLSGLGHSTQSVGKIMDNAMASVKGTAYGLGDAAGIAAGAVAAGVKPGKDLERTLKLVGDAAAIAGTDLGSMGAIFNKVAASNKIQGDVIAQLNDAGIPIIQLLGQELGKSAEETVKLASAGKVNFETFQNAMEKGLGGAALKTGNTTKGAFDNMNAALGRFGATLAGPLFRQAPAGLTGLTKVIDELDTRAKPAMARFEADLTGKYIPALVEFGTQAAKAFQEFRTSDFAQGTMFRLGETLDQIVSTTKEIAPAVGSIVKSLATASAAVGLSTWEIFLSTLEGTAHLLDVTLVPILNTTASLMSDHQGIVTAAALAWAAFRTIPGLMGRASSAITPVTTAVRTVGRETAGMRASLGAMGSDFRRLTPQIGMYGAAMRSLGNNSSTIRGMQSAFIGASSTASGFGQALRVGVTPALGALRSGASSLASFLGGGWGIAIAGATLGLLNYQKGLANAKNQSRLLADSTQAAATAQGELLQAMASGDPDAVTSQAVSNVRALRQEQQSLAETGPSFVQRGIAGWESLTAAIGLTRGETADAAREQIYAADSAKAVAGTLDKLKVSNEDLGRAVSGSRDEYLKLRSELSGTGEDGREAARWLDEQRREYENTRSAMEKIGPAGVELSAALEQIGNAAGDSSERLSGMKRALQALGLLESDAEGAAFETAAMVRKMGEDAAAGWDGAGGLGDALLKDNGRLDETKANAAKLRDELRGLGDQYQQMVAKGMSGAEAWDRISGGLDALAAGSKVSRQELESLGGQFYGLVPPDLADKLLAPITSTEQAITHLQLRSKELSEKPITMTVEDEGVRNAIREIEGLKLDTEGLPPGVVRVTAENQEAIDRLNAVEAKTKFVGTLTAVPRVDLHTALFEQKNDHAQALINYLGEQTPSPEANLIVDNLRANKIISDKLIDDLTSRVADPAVKLQIADAIRDANTINSEIQKIPAKKDVVINVVEYTQRQQAFWDSGQVGPVSMLPPGRATGGRLPTTGPGTGVTDGFLGVNSAGAPIARVDAGEWVINGRNSEKYNRELAMINAGVFPKLPGFADGGRVGNDDLHALVEGRVGGASRPLRGAPYSFGGINWGDCSAAMSAIARFAVGLAPFAARFATGTMAGALASMGFSRGRGGPGDLRFGWYNGGPYGGHTAGTFPDGTNVEMGGQYGGGMVGGSTGSNSPEFTDHAYLPIASSGGRTTSGRSSASTRKRPEWTDKQQLDLENAEIEVRKAEEARTKVEAELAKGKKTQTDLDSANKKIELAQQKVVDLQKKKDDVASWVEDGPAPQAPALSRMFSDAEIERIDAQLAVDAANERRNEVYDDPDSTENEIAKADAELFTAEKALRELGLKSAGDGPQSWSELVGDVAKTAASGYLADTLGVFGIPDEIPPAMRAWQMFEKAQAEQNPHLLEPSADERAAGAQVGPADPGMAPRSEILGDSPVLYDAKAGIAQWGNQIVDGLNQVGGPASEAAAALRAELEKFRGAGRYYNGGPVLGAPGVDQVPAWLTAKEFVVNAASAAAGDNGAILQAINAGAKFVTGSAQPAQQESGSDSSAPDHSRCVHYHLYGIGDVDEALARIRTEEKVRGMTHGGSL
ncbi:hypothetical protein GS926_14795 [Rhodococcus hoagii]|nr:hypothetical protein [Prescottella equi]